MYSLEKCLFGSSAHFKKLGYLFLFSILNYMNCLYILESMLFLCPLKAKGKTLESPLDCKEIQPVHSKGDQSWVFITCMCDVRQRDS